MNPNLPTNPPSSRTPQDIRLHRDGDRKPPPGQIMVSQYEVDSLYEILPKLCRRLDFYKAEVQLQEKELSDLKEEKRRSEVHAQSLLKELKNLQKKLDAQIHETIMKNQNVALQQCQIDRLKSSVETERLRVAAHAEHAEISSLKWENTKIKEKIQEIQAELKVVNSRVQDASHVQLEKKLKQVEAMNDMLLNEKKSLEGENRKLNAKLHILMASVEGEEELTDYITVKKCGRFEIKERRVECTRCRATFTSKAEMEISMCHYHPNPPVPKVDEEGLVENFWLCCGSSCTHKKTSPGCVTGRHCFTNKRARHGN